MRLRNNSETFYAIPYGIANDFIQYKTENFTTSYFTAAQVKEVGAQLVAHTKLNIVTNNVTSYQDAFEYLELKAEVARKTISFWDAYQVKGVLAKGDEDTLSSRIAQLPSNSSVIANTKGDWYENGVQQSYYPGDIFIKDYYNRITHIPMISSGYYYPSSVSLTSGNTAKITYTYASSQPEAESGEYPSDDVMPAKVMNFSVGTLQDEVSYCATYDLEAIDATSGDTFVEITALGTSPKIHPVVKAFINNDGNIEEQLFNAVSITYDSNSNKFTIANQTRCSIIITVK